MQDTNK